MTTLVKAAWALYIANMLSLAEVVFGQAVNGRQMSLEGVDRFLGPCLNFVPIRVKLPPGGRLQDLLHRVHSEQVETMPYGSIPAAEIIEKCTTWPAGPDLRFIVQHQNIQLHQDMPLHDVEVDSMFANLQPLDEVWVFSVPYPDQLEIEVCVDSSVLSGTGGVLFEADSYYGGDVSVVCG